jgi:hypothetical protein
VSGLPGQAPFASVQIRGGQSINVLQALLGHKSAVETWDTYGHLMGDEDDRSRAVIDASLGGLVPGVVRPETGDRSRNGNHRSVKTCLQLFLLAFVSASQKG